MAQADKVAAGYRLKTEVYLVASKNSAREACDAELKAYKALRTKYEADVATYLGKQKDASEKDALLDLAHLAMKKQAFQALRGQVFYEGAMADAQLREINKWIFWTQFAIFAGKAAQLGLSLAEGLGPAVTATQKAAKEAKEVVEVVEAAADTAKEPKKGAANAGFTAVNQLGQLSERAKDISKYRQELLKLKGKTDDLNVKADSLKLAGAAHRCAQGRRQHDQADHHRGRGAHGQVREQHQGDGRVEGPDRQHGPPRGRSRNPRGPRGDGLGARGDVRSLQGVGRGREAPGRGRRAVREAPSAPRGRP